MKSLILLSLFLQFTLISKTFAKTANLFLTPQQYSRLSKPMQKNYVKKIRFEFMQLEKSFGNQKYLTESNQSFQNYFVQNLFINNAFADDPVEQDTDSSCIIGGVQVPVIKNKCSTRNNLCNDENSTIKDSFQCGKVFGSKCVSRLPIKNLSQRCFDEAKDVVIKPEDYTNLTDEATKLFDSICSENIKNKTGCSLFEKKLTALKDVSKNNDITQAAATPNQTPDKTNPPLDDQKPNPKNTKDECNQILNLTIEGTNSNNENSPLRQQGLHNEAANYIAGLADFANTENYWVEPRAKNINNCSGKNPQEQVATSIPEAVTSVINELNSTAPKDVCKKTDSINILKSILTHQTSIEELQIDQIYKNQYESQKLTPISNFENCKNFNTPKTPFVSLNSAKNSAPLAGTEVFKKRLSTLKNKCTGNTKPTISIGVFANAENIQLQEKYQCKFQILNGKLVDANSFFDQVVKPSLESGFKVSINYSTHYNECFINQINDLIKKDQTIKDSKYCFINMMSKKNPGHGINEIFGATAARMYLDFLHDFKNPAKAKICADFISDLENKAAWIKLATNPNNPATTVTTKFLEQCENFYKSKNYESSQKSFLNPEVKKAVLACLKDSKDSNNTLFGLQPALQNQSPSIEATWSKYKESDIADCNQDWSVYKKTAPDKEAATKPTASTTKPAAAAEAKQ